MLTCIARSKQPSDDIDRPPAEKPNSNGAPTKQTINILSSQIKDMALKASGAYRNCAPCANHPAAQKRRNGSYGVGEPDSVAADKFRWPYRRTGSSSSNASSTAGRRELEARLKGISSGEGTPASASGRRVEPVVFVEESEPKEWVAQVEPGVLITFVSLPRGGNDLKQIKFSREMFNKCEAQKWWAENSEKVTELYNVQRLNRQAFPPGSADDTSPVTPPISQERSPYRPNGTGVGSIGGAKTETSSMDDASMRTSSSHDAEETSCLATERVEEDEPGVYLTIRTLPDGGRELRRVRFSREKFGEMHARVWWAENRGRIHKKYL